MLERKEKDTNIFNIIRSLSALLSLMNKLYIDMVMSHIMTSGASNILKLQ